MGGPIALEIAQTLLTTNNNHQLQALQKFRSLYTYDPMTPMKLPRSRKGTRSATMISVKERIPPPP
jgi:hypothetical protein